MTLRAHRSPFAAYAPALIANGYSPLPIAKGHKRPDVKNWQVACEKQMPEPVLTALLSQDRHGVGVACGYGGLVVIDIDTEDGDITALIRRALPASPVAKRGRKGRSDFYRDPSGEVRSRKYAVEKVPFVEVLAKGNQTVIPPTIHPDTGQPYAYLSEATLLNTPVHELPVIPADINTRLEVIEADLKRAGASRERYAAYAAAAIDAECRALASTPEGGRNRALFDAMCRLGRFVHHGIVARDGLEARLVAACQANGLAGDDGGIPGVEATIDSGLEASKGDALPALEDRPRTADAGTIGAIDLNDYESAPRSGVPCYDDFVYIAPQGMAIFTPTQEPWPAHSVNAVLPRKKIGDRDIKPSEWLAKHQYVSQITWLPGEPEIILDKVVLEGGIETRPGFRSYNRYRGPDIQNGDPWQARRWLRHIWHVYPNDFQHLVLWFAHLVQKPGVKINHSIVLGGAQGIGKDTIVKPVIQAIGPWNSITISPATLTEKFNEYARHVLLYINEMRDLGDQTRYQFYETLKPYTAAPPLTTRVNEKFLRPYRIPNLVGVVQNSNYLTDGLYLPADDRRHYLAWSERTRDEFSKEYWDDFHGWLDGEGNGHVAAFLRGLSLSGFDAKAPPPKTPAFWEVVGANRPSEDADIENLLDLLQWPDAITLDDLRENAIGDFGNFLRDRSNFRMIIHRLEAAGYRAVRNPDDRNKGFWKIGTRRQPVYAKAALSERERVDAARRLRRSRSTRDGSPL